MSELTLRPEKHSEKNGAIRNEKKLKKLKERYRRGGGGGGEKHLEQLGEP